MRELQTNQIGIDFTKAGDCFVEIAKPPVTIRLTEEQAFHLARSILFQIEIANKAPHKPRR